MALCAAVVSAEHTVVGKLLNMDLWPEQAFSFHLGLVEWNGPEEDAGAENILEIIGPK